LRLDPFDLRFEVMGRVRAARQGAGPPESSDNINLRP